MPRERRFRDAPQQQTDSSTPNGRKKSRISLSVTEGASAQAQHPTSRNASLRPGVQSRHGACSDARYRLGPARSAATGRRVPPNHAQPFTRTTYHQSSPTTRGRHHERTRRQQRRTKDADWFLSDLGQQGRTIMSTQGSIRKDDSGAWFFVVDIAGPDGKRKQLKRRGFETKRAAQARADGASGRQTAGRSRRSPSSNAG